MIKHCVAALVLISVIAASAAAAPFVPPQADGFVGLWYGYTNGEYYAGGLGTFPQQIHPMAYYAADAGEGGRTFFVYGGATQASPTNLLTTISYYDHATGQVARPRILNNKGTNDGHDNPSMMLDDDGYVYVFSNAHGTLRNSYVYRGTRPYSIDEFETVLTLPGSANFSYSQPWYVPEQGFMLLHTFYQSNPARRLYFNTSADGLNWKYNWAVGGANSRPSLAAMPNGNYQVSGMRGQTVGTAFNTSVDNDRRTNLYYVETSDLGNTWKTAGGVAVNTPMTDPGCAALVHDYQAEGLFVFLKEVRFDSAGQPVLLYLTSSTVDTNDLSTPRTWHTARFDPASDQWIIRRAFESDNNYDHGTFYIEDDGTWRIIAPTNAGPQAGKTGGDMAVWISDDQGANWEKTSLLTHDGQYNNTYARQPVNADDDFYAFWADGDASPKVSLSTLYFTDKDGTGVWRLPTTMSGDFATPELAYTPVALPEPGTVCLLAVGGGMMLIGLSAKHLRPRK
ncbi:MAG: BNR-4 repeat-containing protein [Pirellulales bacterium]|nr:BNR-4 repeat-containing protein [Pirellulales bacterium]